MSDTSQGEGWWQASDLKWYPPSLPPPPSIPTEGLVTVEPAQSKERRKAAWFLVVGAVIAGLAAFLPWAVIRAPFVGQLTKAGIEGDGVFTLLLAAGIGVCGIRSLNQSAQATKSHVVIPTVLAALLLLITIFEFVDLSKVVDDVDSEIPISVSLGSGLYVLGLGAVLAAVGCWLLWRVRPEVVAD